MVNKNVDIPYLPPGSSTGQYPLASKRTLTVSEGILRLTKPLHLGEFGIDFRRRCPVASLGDEWQGCGWQIAFQRQTGGAAIEKGA